jgi:hypothetical protein
MPITFAVTTTKAVEVKIDKPFEFNQVLPNPRPSFYGPNETVSYNLVRGSDISNDAVPIVSNSFVMSAFQAYSSHHNLVIKPDDVWLAICTQFANYVNGNAEALRDQFVDFEGKKELTVQGGGTLKTANYQQLCQDMTVQIAKNIKDPSVREWVLPDFTTTTDTERMVGAVLLMATTKSYFDIKMVLCCDLPSVTLLGEVEDWVKIRQRANKLLEYDLKPGHMSQWSEYLFPVLDKFITTVQGNPDVEWWNRIANQKGGGSGPRYLSGWITSFCLFDNDGKWQGGKTEVEGNFSINWSERIISDWPIININDVPKGYVSVPITVNDNGTVYKTEMFAGHMYAVRGTDGATLEPAVSWALFTIE